jgi:hypothetical protein
MSSILGAGPIDPENHSHNQSGHNPAMTSAGVIQKQCGDRGKNLGRADLPVCLLRFDSQGSTLINCTASSASGLSAPETGIYSSRQLLLRGKAPARG